MISDVILRLLLLVQMNLGHFCAMFYFGFLTFEQKSIGFYYNDTSVDPKYVVGKEMAGNMAASLPLSLHPALHWH